MNFTSVKESFKSGFVTFIGRPNAGKSTLVNALVGEKIAIVSNTVQTTRHRFHGILTTQDYQIVITDTPGVHKPKDALGEELNISAEESIVDVDIVCILIDSNADIGSGDKHVVSMVENISVPKICLLTKIDLATKDQINEQIISASKLFGFDEIIPLSAKSGDNLKLLKDCIVKYLPQGHLWYPSEDKSDVDDEIMIAELVREKVLLNCSQEVPHSIGVVVDDVIYRKKRKIYDIFATIFVERDSQKGIILGKGGAMIQKIGTESRHDIEKFLNSKINLQLNVKLKKNWRRDANLIRRFGYGD